MEAYLYLRYSSAEQSKGSSLERQLQICRDYCDQKGWHHAAARELIDEGVSAYDGSNRAGQSALAQFERMAHDGEIPPDSVLVVERLDRISRESPHAVVRFVSSILEARITIAVASNDRIYSGDVPFDQLIDMVVTARLANEESEKKSDRLRAAWSRKRRLAAQGVPLTAMCPAWLEKSDDGHCYVVIEEKAAHIRRVFEMAAAGHGRGLIAKTLNRAGVPSPSPRAKGWHPSYIQKLLKGSAVIGELQLYRLEDGKRIPDGEPLSNYYPPIVPLQLYRQAQSAMRERINMPGRRGTRISNLFSGLVKCHGCGSTMTYRDKGRQNEQYLVCDSALRGRGCDRRSHWNYNVLERTILDEALDLIADLEGPVVSDKLRHLTEQVAQLEHGAQDLRDRRTRLLDLLSRGPDEQAEQLYRYLGEELDAKQAKVKVVREDLRLAQVELPLDKHADRLREARVSIIRDGPERLAIRLKAQQAARSVIDGIAFDAHHQHVTVVLAGGIAAFRFSISGEVIARSSDLDQIAAAPELAAAWGARADDVARVAQRAAMAGHKRGKDEAALAAHVKLADSAR
ncbi:recombinase family protein [Sphingobium sp. CR2-8]|uniref:recombinase family protein n=1 Tax=Sphingobium sp. CR2-8 TaxID=1306534 RepID=UPI002DB9D56E|nr:recombinase family protein [Sphingobium sp. CR2-8]MEC3910043.1 recombinase family protein [Sphingobium sp. CR2-8]